MNKSFFLFAILFAQNLIARDFPCRTLPEGGIAGDTRRAQYLEVLDPQRPPRPNTFEALARENQERRGNDIVYEGAPCPAEKVCIETVFQIITNHAGLIHGQVVVLDKRNGKVDALLPLRFKNFGATGAPSRRGLNPFNQRRTSGICTFVKEDSGFPYSKSPCEAGFPGSSTSTLDIYAYASNGNTESAFEPGYSAYRPASKARVIEALNSGFVSSNGSWTQSGSTIEQGGAGTFARLGSIVNRARAALGCYVTPPTREDRLREALNRGIGSLQDCPVTLTNQNGQISLTFPSNPTYTGTNPALAVQNPASQVPLTTTFPSTPCYTRDSSSDTENGTFTCENGSLAFDTPPAVRPYPARGTLENPQIIVKSRIQNGRVVGLDIERNFLLYSGDKFSCQVTAPAGTTTPRPGGATTTRQ